jgi:hypothetical protein
MCTCVEQANEALAPHNGRLAMAISINEEMELKGHLLVQVEKIDKTKRKPAPTVRASFCPFCGEELPK